MSFLFFDPKTAAQLKKHADDYTDKKIGATLDPDSDQYSMPATFFDKQIPIMPTAKEMREFHKDNIRNIA